MRLEADAPDSDARDNDAPNFRLADNNGREGRGWWRLATAARERAARLFDPMPQDPITAWAVAVSAVAIVALALYSLLRVGGAGAFNSIWAEDGANFLSDAYMLPATDTIFRPVNGYFLVVPRLIAEAASLVPIGWGPAVLSTSAALLSGAMAIIVYVASGSVLRHTFLRAVAAFWVVAAPLAESTHTFGPNMVASLQFVELYGLFWVLLWTPARRSARLVQLAFVVACCMSTFLAVLFLPMAILRLWATRTRLSGTLLGLLFVGAAFQASGILLGLTSRSEISHPRLDPLWALASFVGWAFPFGIAGERVMVDPGFAVPGVHSGGGGVWYWSGVVGAWLVVAAVLAVAVRRRTSPQWLFAAVAGVQSVLLLCAQITVQGRLELRYAYAPALLAVVGLLGLLRPRTLRRHSPLPTKVAAWLPAVTLVAVLAVSAGVNYRIWTTRTRTVPWDAKVQESTAICRSELTAPFVITYTAPGWFVIVPCWRLR